MKVVLLAAGLGKRLEPLTSSLPKPMIMISGKPILEHIVISLQKYGFFDFCIVVGYLGDKIKSYFGDGTSLGIHISYVEQKIFSGTASATKLAKNFVGNEPFLLYLADTIIPENLENYLQNMINSDFETCILSSETEQSKIGNVGSVEVKNDHVLKITEKSTVSKSNLSWAGVAFFKNNNIFKIIENLEPSERGEFEITEAMNLILNHNGQIGNFTCKKYVDAGTISGILELNKIILNQKSSINFSKTNCDTTIQNPVYVGKNCRIGNKVRLGPFVSIGNDVCIGDNAKLEHVVVLDNSNIKSNEILSKSVIDSKNNILS
ncbi:Glucose-1-phosphate thymidylyltransferase protein [Marine Group I thaumarchaeote SCGC AAA799-P11]|uniref:Glucose-1-phosphate thymidylyltransferase protein n=1 Tax=Marine Group I thaumarchaeote SCGC AAA799-P11 TaxID=1502295 RepID=A0A087S2Y7_9ARCH|nr:Glucose-1-phosphate thymidylyltransferase protein [Marine Group I thaumarchaeote SCGC AAA799-P11]